MPTFDFTAATTGAAAAVEEVFNAVWAIAAEKSDTTADQTQAAIDYATNAPQIVAPDDLNAIDVSAPPAVSVMTISELQTLFDETTAATASSLVSAFGSFLSTYFPVGAELAAAQAWIERALTTGGSGINTNVEAQIWARDRARVMRDSARLEDEAMSTFAARGFPLPPGALAHQLLTIRRDTQDKIAESSSQAAIKSFDAEVANARLAVERAISLRVAAISAAGEYIKVIALGPQIGAQLTSTLVDAQAKLADATTSFYRAEVASKEIPLRIATTNAELQMRTSESNQKAAMDAIGHRVGAAMAAAQMNGTQAAAALNALHANAAISGADTTTISL